MTGRLDWRRAKKTDLSEPGYKERRLDKAADNWLDHGSLGKKPLDQKPAAKGKRKRK